jgi:hypothetical protein
MLITTVSIAASYMQNRIYLNNIYWFLRISIVNRFIQNVYFYMTKIHVIKICIIRSGRYHGV